MRRYDGSGKLIETIEADACTKRFWEDFDKVHVIDEDRLAESTGSQGVFTVIQRINKKLPERECGRCGDPFTPPLHKPQAKYCRKPNTLDNQQCRVLHRREKNKQKERLTNCNLCNAEFYTIRKDAAYCGDPCNSKLAQVKATAEAIGFEKVCRHCGNKFTTKKGNVFYCRKPDLSEAAQCRYQADMAKRQAKLKHPGPAEYSCRFCDKKFMSTRGPRRSIYCGDPCGAIESKRRSKTVAPTLHTITCRRCSLPFETRKGNRAFCHNPCTHAKFIIESRRSTRLDRKTYTKRGV